MFTTTDLCEHVGLDKVDNVVIVHWSRTFLQVLRPINTYTSCRQESTSKV